MKRERLVGAAIILASLLIAGSVALATIPSKSGRIFACYARKTGELRIIDKAKGQTCVSRERQVVWNQRGPQGSVGPVGDKGPQGPTGQDGAQGPQGDPGALIARRIRPASPPYAINNGGNAPGQNLSYPLAPAGYDKPANTLAILYAKVTVTKPDVCDMSAVIVTLKQDGTILFTQNLQPAMGASETALFQTYLWEDAGHHYDYTSTVAGCTGTMVDLQVDIVEIT